MKAKRMTEYIDMQTVDWWVCLCGNRPDYEGFFPCNEDGEPVESTPSVHSLRHTFATNHTKRGTKLVLQRDFDRGA